MKRDLLLTIMLAVIYGEITTSKNATLSDRVRKAIALLNIPEMASGGGDETSLQVSLRDIVIRLISRSNNGAMDVPDLLISLESSLIYHPEVLNFFKKTLGDIATVNQEEINIRANVYGKKVKDYTDCAEIARATTELSFKIRDAQLAGDRKLVATYLDDYHRSVEGFRAITGTDNPMLQIGGIREISGTEDEASMETAFTDAEVTYEGKGLLKLGCQGWNDSFGPEASIPRGVMIELQALSGCSKSETIRRMLSDICVFNRPYVFNEKAKPIVIYFTAEDTSGESWDKMYRQMYCEETSEFPIRDITAKQRTKFVKKRLNRNGIDFTIVSCRKNGTTMEDVIEVLEAYKGKGYEVIACGVDYMGLFSHDHYDANLLDTFKIQRKHSVIGGYCKENKITVFVANQLGTAPAQELAGEVDDFARDAAIKGFSVGSSRILDELDGRIVVHIKEHSNGTWYHQWSTSKLRWAKGWKVANKYCTYAMHNIEGKAAGFVMSDLGMESQACRDMSGGLKSGKDGGGAYF
jgi:DNA-directed RNA polymerase subunit N (RpoN/RPB10)